MNDCIEHTQNVSGYGTGWDAEIKQRKGLHVMAWAKKNGRYPEKGMHIGHKCDNKRCVNPDHLEEITPSKNSKDSYDRGLQTGYSVKGEKISKNLTNEMALEIFHAEGTNRGLAAKYGISKSVVGDIKTGYKWSSVTGKEYKHD